MISPRLSLSMTGDRRLRGEVLGGRQAIVTGGGSGIGAALTRALAAAGADVVCADIDLAAAQRVASQAGTRPDGRSVVGTIRAVPLDVTDADAVAGVVAEVVDRAGHLDLMFNNAGITWGGPTEQLTLEQWNAIIDVNIRGVVHGVAAAYPQMIAQRHGHIINTASMGGLTAAGLITSYVMTKHAVVGLTLALRRGGGRTRCRCHGDLPGRGGDADSGQGQCGWICRPRLLPVGTRGFACL